MFWFGLAEECLFPNSKKTSAGSVEIQINFIIHYWGYLKPNPFQKKHVPRVPSGLGRVLKE
jgi:hypothetical protein